MTSLSHTEIWTAIDALAKRFDMSPSAMAKMAGLDPTSFNRSKRGDGDSRPRWPSTESLAKVLEATGVGFSEFAALTERAPRPNPRAVPLIGFAQAGAEGAFDETGAPIGSSWDEIDFPGLGDEGVYALEITGDDLAPVFRDGDRILVSPSVEPRGGAIGWWCAPRAANCWSRNWRGSRPAASNWLRSTATARTGRWIWPRWCGSPASCGRASSL
jgi:phage repressor protein C with HTH and peptisase S24 domain